MLSYSFTQSYNIKLLYGAHKLYILSPCGLLDHHPLTRKISINADLNTTSPENLKLKTEKGHFKILYIICPSSVSK